MSVFASRPLVFSTLLHASVAGLLLVVMLRMQREPAPMPVVLEWVTAAPAQAGPLVGGAVAHPSLPTVNFTPLPLPVRAGTPVVADVPPESEVRAVPSARTPVASQTAPVRTTITEHRRRTSSPVAAKPTGPTRAPTAARINMDEVLAGVGQVGPTPAVVTDPALEAGYWAALLGKLRAVHQKPAELDDGLSARVEFVLRADGSVGDVRILASSGSAVFDASVVAAFRRLSDLGPPPAGKAGVNQVTFRTRTE